MKARRLTRAFVLALAAVALTVGARASLAQGPMLFRQRATPAEVLVTEVRSRQAGTIAGQIAQEVEQDVTTLSLTRAVEGDLATKDDYTLAMRLYVKVGDQVQVDTAAGQDLDLGEIDPRGICVTTVTDSRGHVEQSIGATGQEDPLAKLQTEMYYRVMELPEQAISVGDTWKTSSRFEMWEGQATAEVAWRFDRIEEVDGRQVPVLVGEATITTTELSVPPKSITTDIGNGPQKLTIKEQVSELTLKETIELRWDTEKARIGQVIVQQQLDATTSQSVFTEQGTPIGAGQEITVSRQGTTETVDRAPTDEELGQMVTLALTNSIQRKDLALLRSVQAPQADLRSVEDELTKLFAEYSSLRATAKDIRFAAAGDEATVRLRLTITGRKPEARPGPDVSDVIQILDREATLSLERGKGMWLLRGVA